MTSSLFAQCLNQNPSKDEHLCPQFNNYIPLGNTYTPAGIFLGHEQHGETDNAAYLGSFIDEIREIDKSIKINILISKTVFGGVKTTEFKTLVGKYKEHLNLIPIDDEMPSWIQDPILFVFNPKLKAAGIQGLPYPRSPNIYKDIAKFCNLNKLETPNIAGYGGNHGGNIDHLFAENIMIGDSSSPELRNYFESKNINVVTVSTDWLNVGHADEVILPLPAVGKCPLAVAYASPFKALQLLSDQSFKKCPQKLIKNLEKLGFRTEKDCLSLVKASTEYQKKIEQSVQRIQKLNSCIQGIEFPVIFVPEKLHKENYGTKEDRAKSIIPNPMNSIVLNKNLITPWQRVLIFENFINNELSKLGLKASYIKNKDVHWSGGNVHCTSNILRTCK